jgi:hypothetical protein
VNFDWLEEAFREAVDNIFDGCAEHPEKEEEIRKAELVKLRSKLVLQLNEMLNRIRKSVTVSVEKEREVVA